MAHGNLKMYEAEHLRLARRPRFMAYALLAMDSSQVLRERALAAMAARPGLFEGLLAMHVGAARPLPFAKNCLALGWRMLAAL